eukprot:6729183-Heterocapsa_arctica.AAC.1
MVVLAGLRAFTREAAGEEHAQDEEAHHWDMPCVPEHGKPGALALFGILGRIRMQRVALRHAEELLPVIRAGTHPFLIMPAENALLVVVGRED